MTVKELINCLQLLPENYEVIISNPEWPIKKVHEDEAQERIVIS